LPDTCEESYHGLAVSHVGTLYIGRDPSPLLRAYRRFLDEDPDARDDGSMIRLVGHIEDSHRAVLHNTISGLRLQEHVKLLGVVERNEALKVLGRSRIAVVLAQDQDFQIPAKLYEPLAMGLETVVLAGHRSAAGREGNRIGATVIDPTDEDGLVRYFHEVRSREHKGAVRPLERIRQSALALAVDRVLSANSANAD
jgi:glycosyltransferase involved in cell wall biosynthesis